MPTIFNTIQLVRNNRKVMDKGFQKAVKHNHIAVIKFIYELRECKPVDYNITFASYIYAHEFSKENGFNEIYDYMNERMPKVVLKPHIKK